MYKKKIINLHTHTHISNQNSEFKQCDLKSIMILHYQTVYSNDFLAFYENSES